MHRPGRRRARRRRRRGTRDGRSGRRAGPAAIRRRRTASVSNAEDGRGSTAPSQAPGWARRTWSARTPSALVRPDLAGPATRTWSPGRTAKPIGLEVGIADAHEDDVVVGRHDEQVVHRDVVGQRPDAGCGATWRRPPGGQTRPPLPPEGQDRRPEPRVPGRRGGPAPGTSWVHRRRAVRTARARPGRPGGTATSGRRSTPAPRGWRRADPPRSPPPHRPPALRPAHGPARRAGRSGGTPPARPAAPAGRRSGRAGGADAGRSARCRAVDRAPGGAPGRTVRCAPDRPP